MNLKEIEYSCNNDCKSIIGDAPVIFRGLVSHWPMVEAAKKSFEAFSEYLIRFDRRVLMEAMLADPSQQGRLAYNEELNGFNFDRINGYLLDALDILASLRNIQNPPVFYLGSMDMDRYFNNLINECRLKFLDYSIIPNIWIGNRTVVAIHNDNAKNIACVTAGRRKFTLFPPDLHDQLYIADLPFSPGGRPISLVDLKNPDFERYPLFKDALVFAQHAILKPGDAIYIPRSWWHHVEGLDELNVLVNFWWDE